MKIILIAFLFLVIGCKHVFKNNEVTDQRKPELKSEASYKVINLGENFKKFWAAAQGKDFDQQLVFWNNLVEKPYQDFYDEMVWQKNTNAKWEERKIRRLRLFFKKYQTLAPEVIVQFDQFNQTLDTQIGKFKKVLPDADFQLPIYAAPTATFNGKGGEGGDAGSKLGETVLAFGIDMMVDLEDDPDVLYSHELFHIYHTHLAAVNEQVFMNQGKLTLPLWLEGLATYFSLQMNPQASLEKVLMDKELSKVSARDISKLAKRFIQESEEKAFDIKKPEIYKKWFALEAGIRLSDHYPMRCGYLLGLKVSEQLAKKYPLSEMVRWNVDQIHKHVKQALTEISQSSGQ